MPDNNLPFPVAQPTQQQQLQRQANQLQMTSNNLYSQLQTVFANTAQFCWQPPAGLTPQDMFDLFGTNAGTLFKLAGAYSAMMAEYAGTAPVSPVPVGYTYAINADGTVTVIKSS